MHEGHAMKLSNDRVPLDYEWQPPRPSLRTFVFNLVIAAAVICSAEVRAQSVTNCFAAPSGLIAWWPGDGTATNLTGMNHGTLREGAAFGLGLVGAAFGLDGID